MNGPFEMLGDDETVVCEDGFCEVPETETA